MPLCRCGLASKRRVGSLGGSTLACQDKKVRSLKLFGPHTLLEHICTRARTQKRSDSFRVASKRKERILLTGRINRTANSISTPRSRCTTKKIDRRDGRLRPHRNQRRLCAVQGQRQVNHQVWRQRGGCCRRAQAEAVSREHCPEPNAPIEAHNP